MSLAKKLVQLRKARNLTQKELAKIVGVHFSHMSRYERGISLPSVEVIKKISQVFNVSTDYLLFDDADEVIRAHIADQELLRQFERISQMSEPEKAAVKTVLEGVIVKHEIERMLGVHKTAPAESPPLPSWPSKQTNAELLQRLDRVVDGVQRTAPTRS